MRCKAKALYTLIRHYLFCSKNKSKLRYYPWIGVADYSRGVNYRRCKKCGHEYGHHKMEDWR